MFILYMYHDAFTLNIYKEETLLNFNTQVIPTIQF